MQFNPQRPRNATKVASFKPHCDKRILVYEMKDQLEHTKDVIKRRYRRTVDYNKEKINTTLQPFYGKPLLFSDKVTTEVKYRIQEMTNETGKSIDEIAREFRDYLGYRSTFFRKEGERSIPIDRQRIMTVYRAMKQKRPVKEIEKLLFY
jgi:transposase-like protein